MPRTLLIIDDNKSVRDSLRFLLERRGYAIATAESGAEGLAMARATPIDGALVDVNMPGMNGLAACRALKALAAESGRPLTVWMMTGARTAELAKASVEAGAVLLFAKPFDFAELFRLLAEALGPTETPAAPPDVLDQL